MINRNLVDTFTHKSEKKTSAIYLSIFFLNTIPKNHFMFAVCIRLNYIFLLIFAGVIENNRINQA